MFPNFSQKYIFSYKKVDKGNRVYCFFLPLARIFQSQVIRLHQND
ncbi:MAG: hypothetical protein RL757_319 [Bacteroidota bacterium]|jgi:hypothetical protein